MYICICNAVSDQTIRSAVRRYQPVSIQDLKKVVPVGTKCGKCLCKVSVIMEDELQSLLHYEKIA
ncbi:bacterioferritin-associated ferredoxin [Martelella alba]|uniref:Bacterioferritin-associated ferredoxin n=1 Tax=Martelella alba TaxID=2590451 RepID=A0ABY2SHN7_9HYPH|nr:bacterioferritin-associated ferredoxin [Martelella alba]TKI03279.1 bacterioferritin-associated ferredoxin [Martelella alba]